MIRVYTHMTLDANGYPTAAGAYFDVEFGDFSVILSSNMVVAPLRNGLEVLMFDSKPQYPVRGNLSFLVNLVDLESSAQYGGEYLHLGNSLYKHCQDHEPIAVAVWGHTGAGRKCYVAHILSFDEALAAVAMDDETIPCGYGSVDPRRMFSLVLKVDQHGTWGAGSIDIEDANWVDRVS